MADGSMVPRNSILGSCDNLIAVDRSDVDHDRLVGQMVVASDASFATGQIYGSGGNGQPYTPI